MMVEVIKDFNKENSDILNNLKKYKKLADLHGIIIKPEKINGKIILNKFYNPDGLCIVLSAVVWNINNWFNYKKYISQIIIPYNQVNTTNYKEIKYKLLSNIYSDVIKLV